MYEEIIPVNLENGLTVNAVLGYTDDASPDSVAILFPPHPLLGGDMENNVVTALFKGFTARNYMVVRFSYRGVDTGEVNGEHYLAYWDKLEQRQDFTEIISDTHEVLTSVIAQINPTARIIFVPYSFGTIIALALYDRFLPAKFVGIAPPVNEYDFSRHLRRHHDVLFVLAQNDPFCSRLLLDKLDAAYTVCDADDHFFRGYEDVLWNKITQLVEEQWKTQSGEK
ncbi:hypothetical protein KDK77_04450 [bacterium]|nr:hypothetical protein [bacterium]MCP5462265.1 hypothetical protein [bacterium]